MPARVRCEREKPPRQEHTDCVPHHHLSTSGCTETFGGSSQSPLSLITEPGARDHCPVWSAFRTRIGDRSNSAQTALGYLIRASTVRDANALILDRRPFSENGRSIKIDLD